VFKDEVQFEKTPSFGQNNAGYAVVNIDDDNVEVVYESEYSQVPVVNVSLMVDDEKIGEVLAENYNFTITNRTTKGFTIKLGKKAKSDLKFAWSAVLVRDAKTYQKPTINPLPTIEPTIIPLTPTLFLTPTMSEGVTGVLE
jgi:hypothetical protein